MATLSFRAERAGLVWGVGSSPPAQPQAQVVGEDEVPSVEGGAKWSV